MSDYHQGYYCKVTDEICEHLFNREYDNCKKCEIGSKNSLIHSISALCRINLK